MKTLSGSILILAAAVVFQPGVVDQYRLDEAVAFALLPLVAGVILIVKGWRSDA